MRLIDADAFLKDILTAGIGKTIIEYSESDIGYMIKKRPSVDAVSVVRCKDCLYWNGSICDLHSEWPDQYSNGHLVDTVADDFCSYGERKDNG